MSVINYQPFLKTLTAAAILLAACPYVSADPAQDMIVGNGTSGPFALSWQGIAANTEIVQVNQQTQTRGLDYSIDAQSGTITFVRPLTIQSAASVHYEYDPRSAVRTAGTPQIPLSFSVAKTENAQVSFDALYQSPRSLSPADSQPAPGSLTLALGTGWQGKAMQMTTRLLFAPALDTGSGGQNSSPAAGSGGQNSSPAGRLGVVLDGTLQAARGAILTAEYLQAGDKMTSAAENGLVAGRQTLTLGTSLALPWQGKAAVKWAQSSSSAAAGGAASTSASASLSLAPASSVQVQSHWTGTSGGGTASTQRGDVSISASPNSYAAIDATLSATDGSSTTSNSQAINLAASLTPMPAVAVKVDAGQTRDAGGFANQQGVSIALMPRPTLQLQTGLALRQTGTTQAATTSVGGQIQPLSFLQFSAAYKNRTVSAAGTAPADALSTSTANLTLTPCRAIRVVGSYAQNPDNGGDTAQHLAQRGFGVETTLGAFSVSGGYDWQRAYDTPLVGTNLRVGVGLRLSGATSLSGSYKQTLSGAGDDPTGTTLYGFGLTHALGDRFNLSLDGTMQQPVSSTLAASPDYTAHASLGMKF